MNKFIHSLKDKEDEQIRKQADNYLKHRYYEQEQ